MSTSTWDGTTTMVTHTCGGCGVVFGMSEVFYNQRLRDHKGWYCINGCRRIFSGESDVERLTRERDYAQSSRCREHEAHETTKRQRNALKGHLKRVRKRTATGTCPCCKRTFKQLARHMQGQHPKYVASQMENK